MRSLLYSDEYDFLYHEDTDFSPLRQLTAEGGQVAVEGNVSSLVYEEPRQAGGFFRRLLG